MGLRVKSRGVAVKLRGEAGGGSRSGWTHCSRTNWLPPVASAPSARLMTKRQGGVPLKRPTLLAERREVVDRGEDSPLGMRRGVVGALAEPKSRRLSRSTARPSP